MNPSGASLKETRIELKKLQTKRNALEEERSAIVSELTANGPNGEPPMGIDSPLVDREGFPRGDIDLYRARTLRKRFHEIQNDQKELHGQCKDTLERLHQLQAKVNGISAEAEAAELAARRAPKPKPYFDKSSGKWVVTNWDGSTTGNEDVKESSASPARQAAATPTQPVAPAEPVPIPVDVYPEPDVSSLRVSSFEPLVPFARVNQVSADSPSFAAGLKEGDLLLKFGSVNYRNHDGLSKLAIVVPEAFSHGAILGVTVQRGPDARVVNLKLRPQTWTGRGLLGCHILPL